MSLRQRLRRTADGGTTHDLASLPPTWLASCMIQAAVAVFSMHVPRWALVLLPSDTALHAPQRPRCSGRAEVCHRPV